MNLLFNLFISINTRGLKVWFHKLAVGDQLMIDVILGFQLRVELSDTARKREVYDQSCSRYGSIPAMESKTRNKVRKDIPLRRSRSNPT